MPKDFKKLKKLFANDPEMLRSLEHEEMMSKLSEKNAQEIKAEYIKGDKGDKGDDGYTPIKGVDYFTDDEVGAVAEYIKETVKDEVRPIKGVDYFDGEDGKDADEEKIVSKIVKKIPTKDEIIASIKLPQPEKIDEDKLLKKFLNQLPEPKVLTIDDIIQELKKGKHLELRDIKGARLDMSDQRWHGGGLSNITGLITAGTNITITGSGTKTDPYVINSTGGGTPGGSNTQLQYNNAGAFGGISGATTDGTTVTYTTGNLVGADIKASSSSGLQILSNNGTVTALFGAGGGANSTFYGGSKFDYATASTIAIFDGSKNLISADTATYPSLTELSYVKGVTSSIQTQLNSKASATAYTLAGVSAISTDATKSLYTMSSGVPVEYRTSGGSTLLYLDETNGRIGIGTSSPQQALHVSTATNYQGIFINGNAAPSVGFRTSNNTTPTWIGVVS